VGFEPGLLARIYSAKRTYYHYTTGFIVIYSGTFEQRRTGRSIYTTCCFFHGPICCVI
jgi:hypothetical protein